MVELFFQVHFHLDRNTDINVPWENRCAQCNSFFVSPDALQSHIRQQHTFPVRAGTVTHYKATVAVRQRFQEGLPAVILQNGRRVVNRFRDKVGGHDNDDGWRRQ